MTSELVASFVSVKTQAELMQNGTQPAQAYGKDQSGKGKHQDLLG